MSAEVHVVSLAFISFQDHTNSHFQYDNGIGTLRFPGFTFKTQSCGTLLNFKSRSPIKLLLYEKAQGETGTHV